MLTEVRQMGNIMANMSAWKNPSVGRVYDKCGICPTLNACVGGGGQPHIIVTKIKGSTTVKKDTAVSEVEMEGYRIRQLTPKECWRLMGFSDEDFEAAAAVNSNTQLYAQAGNSIVVDVLEAIFKNMLPEEE